MTRKKTMKLRNDVSSFLLILSTLMQFSLYNASFLYIAYFLYIASFTICILFLCVSEEINNVLFLTRLIWSILGKNIFGNFPKTEMTSLSFRWCWYQPLFMQFWIKVF